MPHAFSTAMVNSRAPKGRWIQSSYAFYYPLLQFIQSLYLLSYSIPAMNTNISFLFLYLLTSPPVLWRSCMCSCLSWCWFWLAQWCRTRKGWCSSRFTVNPYLLPKSCWRTCPMERAAVLGPSAVPSLAMTKVKHMFLHIMQEYNIIVPWDLGLVVQHTNRFKKCVPLFISWNFFVMRSFTHFTVPSLMGVCGFSVSRQTAFSYH